MNSLRDPGLVVALGLAVLVCVVVARRVRPAEHAPDRGHGGGRGRGRARPRVAVGTGRRDRGTLAQALVLPAVVCWARLPQDSGVAQEEQLAQTVATQEALHALPQLAAGLHTDSEVTDRLRREYQEHPPGPPRPGGAPPLPAGGGPLNPFITHGHGYASDNSAVARTEVIQVPWWETVLFLIAVGVAIWGFISMVGVRTRFLTRRTTRTAQDLYGNYADSPRKQRQFAREHGGEWSDREDTSSSLKSHRP